MPHFQSCPLCGQQFGSASIGIHVPQCYQKQLKRWEAAPARERGPKPLMPMPRGASARGFGGQPWNAAMEQSRFDAPPTKPQSFSSPGQSVDTDSRDTQWRDAQSEEVPLRGRRSGNFTSSPKFAVPQQQFEPTSLPTCRYCGRHFAPDRVAKHENVCIERDGAHRKSFNSKKQRLSEFDTYELRASAPRRGGGGSQPRGAGTGAVPMTNWRQQHSDFIQAIRAARAMGPAPGSQKFASSPGVRGGGSNVRTLDRFEEQPREARNAMRAPPRTLVGAPRSSFQSGRAPPSDAVGPDLGLPEPRPRQQARSGASSGSSRHAGSAGPSSPSGPSYQISTSNETSQGMRDAFRWR